MTKFYEATFEVTVEFEQDSIEELKKSFKNVKKRLLLHTADLDSNIVNVDVDSYDFDDEDVWGDDE